MQDPTAVATSRVRGNKPRQRAARPKVKTGCLICKRRRIKCDEGKPGCRRCKIAGWQCQYSISGREDTSETESKALVLRDGSDIMRVTVRSALRETPRALIFQNEQEYQAFQTFCSKTVFALAGAEEPDVWNTLVLQACESHESIMNTVIALGALDRTLHIAQMENQEPSFDLTPKKGHVISHHEFALQQYGKAVKQMRQQLGKGKLDLRTTLISCLLFVAFELFHGNHTSALAQGSFGLDLIMQKMRASRTHSPNPKRRAETLFSSIEEALIQKFVRLDLTSMSFVDETVIRGHVTNGSEGFEHMQAIPETFSSLSDAQKYWELSMRPVMDFMSLAKTWEYVPLQQSEMAAAVEQLHLGNEEWSKLKHIPFSAIQYQAISQSQTPLTAGTIPKNPHMQRAFDWGAAFAPLYQRSLTAEGQSDYIRATLLQIRLLVTMISASTNESEGELQFDQLNHLYREIIGHVKSLYSLSMPSTYAAFTFDVGPVGPLFIVASRCRDCVVRRQAIELLLERPRRECLWDSEVAARFAMAVMVMEERGLKGGFIPEIFRIRVEGISFDLLHSCGRLRYSRGKWRPRDERMIENLEITW